MASKEEMELFNIRKEITEKKDNYLEKKNKGFFARFFPTPEEKAETANYLGLMQKEQACELEAIDLFNKSKLKALEALLDKQVTKIINEQSREIAEHFTEKIRDFILVVNEKKVELAKKIDLNIEEISKLKNPRIRESFEKSMYVQIDKVYQIWDNEIDRLDLLRSKQ